MKYYIYGFKNRLIGQFDRPVAELVEPKDYEANISMGLIAADPAALARTKEFDVYCLGEFDVKSGEIKSCCDFVCSLEPICVRILEHKEKKNVGDGEVKEA